jgi:hypothetical protein
VTFDFNVWASPRDLDDGRAATMIDAWQATGGDPRHAPFEPSTDIGWFYRELTEDLPDLQATSDAVRGDTVLPVWMSGTDEAPARVVAIRLAPTTAHDTMRTVAGLAAKYDLVVFDARRGRQHRPLAEMSAYAGATFWPAGAVQAGVAGAIGAAMAVGAWLLEIPVLSGVVVILGGLLLLMAALTFVHEGYKAVSGRRRGGGSPPVAYRAGRHPRPLADRPRKLGHGGT